VLSYTSLLKQPRLKSDDYAAGYIGGLLLHVRNIKFFLFKVASARLEVDSNFSSR
jgi:hypothetical protein